VPLQREEPAGCRGYEIVPKFAHSRLSYLVIYRYYYG
jgi:hypothetical protein